MENWIQKITARDISKYLAAIYCGWLVVKSVNHSFHVKANQRKAEAVLNERNYRWVGLEDKLMLPISEELERHIISLDLQGLRKGLILSRFTSVQLVQVFARRCYIIGRENNYTADERFSEAFSEAEIADSKLREYKKQGRLEELPALHGIPISVKEMVRKSYC